MEKGAYQYYPRRRRGGMWIILLIILVVVIIYANSKGLINLGSLNLGSLGNFTLGGNTVNSCVQNVDTCAGVINSKFGTTVSVLNSTQVQNANDANSFLSTWKGSSQAGSISSYNISSYPIVLVATRFNTSTGILSPYVFICKSDGNLEEKSISGLC